MEMIVKLFRGFGKTLRETNRIFFTNGGLMASVASFNALLYSLLLIANSLALRPLTADLDIKMSLLPTTSTSSQEYIDIAVGIAEDFGVMIGLELIFIFSFSVASVYSWAATILVSSTTLSGKKLSCRDLAVATARLWKRPLVTFFYASMFLLSYVFILFVILLPFLFTSTAFSVIFSKVTWTFAVMFYAYLAVTWTAGFIVSVVEEKHGMEALGQGAQLVKGIKFQGFCLTILGILLSYGLMQIKSLLQFKQSYVMELLIGVAMVNGVSLVCMYTLMAFTVLYHESKRMHDEKAESSPVSFEYTKMPSLLPITESLIQ